MFRRNRGSYALCLAALVALCLAGGCASGGAQVESDAEGIDAGEIAAAGQPGEVVEAQVDAVPVTAAEGAKPAQQLPEIAAGTAVTADQLALYGEDAFFTVEPISDALLERMWGLSYKEDCTVPREELRYIRVLHVDAAGTTLVGELVMNAAVAQDVCDIFRELYHAGYPIEKMHLVDDYGASDDASMEDDNTSAFNYRVIAGTSQLSNHAFGRAIDINPYYNPYVIPEQDYVSPGSAYEYGDRSWSFPYKIERGDLCYQLFTEHGFTWGGDWGSPKDYQHFEKEA